MEASNEEADRVLAAFGTVALAVAGVLWLKLSPSEAQGQSLYSVKFLCGQQTTPDPLLPPNEPPVKFGNYATAVNIHNFRPTPVRITKKAVIALPQGPVRGQISNVAQDTLDPNQALEVDCDNIVALFPPGTTLPTFIKGFVEIISPVELSVVGVYTAQTCLDAPGSCSVFGDLTLEVVPYRQAFLL